MILPREGEVEMPHETGCEFVGEEMADIAGIGILVGFIGQAGISLLLAGWVFFLSKVGSLNISHQQGTLGHRLQTRRLETVSDILMVGNDMQMTLGISYMITVYAGKSTLDVYHLRLVFDIVSFVGVSNAAAMICWTFCKAQTVTPDSKYGSKTGATDRVSYFSGRHRAIYLFALFYLALTIYLCTALREWAPEAEPGRCYHTNLVSRPDADHPESDILYVIFTAIWTFLVMAGGVVFGANRRHTIIIMALLQFIVHLYMSLALRAANQGYLEGDEPNEDAWDFGQTTAVVLLGIAVMELIRKSFGFWKWSRGLKRGEVAMEEQAAPLNNGTHNQQMQQP